MSYHSDLDLIRQEMAKPDTPEQKFEELIERIVSDMIDVYVMACDPLQRSLVHSQAIGIAQILLRAQLILERLEGRDIEAIKQLIATLERHRFSKLRVVG